MRFLSALEHLPSAQSSFLVGRNRVPSSPLTQLQGTPPPALASTRATLSPLNSASLPATPQQPSLRVTERISSFSPTATSSGRYPGVPASAPSVAMASTVTATEPAEVLVKAATGEPEKLGDCPFCHRVLITLEEKAVPYTLKLVDTSNKPEWFLEINPDGKVPVYKRNGVWLAESDAITAALEEDFPESTKLENTPEHAQVGGSLFGTFVRFLKGSGSEEDLLTQLQDLDDAIKASGGPFVAGKEFTAVDARLTPALYHLHTALKHFKDWTIPEKYSHVLAYVEAVEGRDSFKKTAAPESVVIAGWNRALGVVA